MKILVGLFFSVFIAISCGPGNSTSTTNKDTVRLNSGKLDYEVIIAEPGFTAWLEKQKPMQSQKLAFLEKQNIAFSKTFNTRVNNPDFDANLYASKIEYDKETNYGKEVNYKLYNYFVYFQEKYEQQL